MKMKQSQTAVFAGLCCGLYAASAATIVKTNNVDDLNLPSSWVGGAVPGAADVAQWDATVTGANSVVLGADLAWGGIRIANPGGVVTIGSGNTLALGASGIDMGSSTVNLTIQSGLTLLGSRRQLWNVASGRTLTLNTGAFTREPGALLLVQGSGTISAPAVPNDATGLVGPWAHLGSGSATRYIAINAGTVAAYNGTVVANAAGVTDTTGTANYEVGAGGTVGAGASVHTLRYTGGAATISGAFEADGLMHCGSGTLTVGGPVTVGGGRELVVLLPSGQQVTLAGALSNNAAGASALVKGGSGQLRLQGEYAFTGPITVGEGTLQLAPPTSGGIVPCDVFLNSGGNLQYNSGSSQTFTGVIAGPGQIYKWNGGVWTLAGSNTFEGSVQIYAGTVRLAHPKALGAMTGGTQLRRHDDGNRGRVELNGISTDEPFSFEDGGTAGSSLGFGGYLDNDNTATNATLTGPITLNKHGTFRGNGTMILAGSVSGPGNFVKDGSGTVNVDTNLTFTGNLAVNAGSLHLRATGLLGGGAYAGSISVGGSFLVNVSATQTLSGTVSGNGTIQKWRSEGTLVLNGSNTFSGLLQVYAGTVRLGHNQALGSVAGATQIRRFDDSNRGVLDLNGQSINEPLQFIDGGGAGTTLGYAGFLENQNVLASATNAGAVTLTHHGTVRGAGDITLAGAVSGPGQLIKAGAGALTLTGVNSYTGATAVTAGVLRLGAAGALPAASDVVLSGGTLDAGTIANAGASLTISGNSTLALGSGAQLTFGDSSGKPWSGTLTITGMLGPQSLRFPNGLTTAQVLSITYNGARVYLTQAGYIVDYPPGTVIMLQ